MLKHKIFFVSEIFTFAVNVAKNYTFAGVLPKMIRLLAVLRLLAKCYTFYTGWQILSDFYVCWRSIIHLLAFYVCWRSLITYAGILRLLELQGGTGYFWGGTYAQPPRAVCPWFNTTLFNRQIWVRVLTVVQY